MGGSLQTTIRDLARRRGRERRGLTLAEGVRLVEEALAAGIAVRGAAVSPALEATTRGRSLKSELSRRGVPLEQVGEAELDRLADTEHPQGVVAVIEPRRWRLEDLAPGAGSMLLVLDAVQDPGNVGAILRTALGLGAAGVVALKGTAELTNPKAVRGSMGALFKLPAVSADTEEFLAWARDRGVRIWITAAEGEPLGTTAGRRQLPPVALVLGNEGAGVGPALEAAAERRVAIPLAAGVESLNVAVAAGIFLYEVMRAD
ncbi:MAG: RNA methyltransferase [Gemmatimonadales bacterium]|nr:RNA methyltransferase [Gemmatimonadales bacterium]